MKRGLTKEGQQDFSEMSPDRNAHDSKMLWKLLKLLPLASTMTTDRMWTLRSSLCR